MSEGIFFIMPNLKSSCHTVNTILLKRIKQFGSRVVQLSHQMPIGARTELFNVTLALP